MTPQGLTLVNAPLLLKPLCHLVEQCWNRTILPSWQTWRMLGMHKRKRRWRQVYKYAPIRETSTERECLIVTLDSNIGHQNPM